MLRYSMDMETELNSLIDKYLNGTLSSAERVKLEVWLNGVHLSKEVVPDWSDEHQDRNWELIVRKIGQQEPSSAVPQDERRAKRRVLFPLLWSVAFIALTFSLVTVFDWEVSSSTRIVSEPGHLILPDGTLVWLRANSELAYPSAFEANQREVVLNGEALFEVAGNASWPFLIRCEDYTAKVLGTSFNIRSTPSDIEVIVLTGTVSVGPTGGADGDATILYPNDRAVFSRAARVVSTAPVATTERSRIMANTTYDMNFEDATIETVAARIHEKFNVTVEFDDPLIANCRISADFTDQRLEATLKMICEALDLTCNLVGRKVKISGEPCLEDRQHSGEPGL